MLAVTSVAGESLELKKERKAILLAQHYQSGGIPELAGVIGDSLEWARKARDFADDVIAFAGVKNAVKVVNSIPRERPLQFLPHRNRGLYRKRQTGRANRQIWQGPCIVHATFPASPRDGGQAGASAGESSRELGVPRGRAGDGRFRGLHIGAD